MSIMFNFDEMKEISNFLIIFGTATTAAAIYKISRSGSSSSITNYFFGDREVATKTIDTDKAKVITTNTEFDNFDLTIYN